MICSIVLSGWRSDFSFRFEMTYSITLCSLFRFSLIDRFFLGFEVFVGVWFMMV